MGADHDHNIRPYRDHNIRPYRNYFTHFQGKPGLDTARLQEIYDYLSQLQAPYGFIPESLNEPFDPYDSSQWDSQLLKDPNPAAGILPSQNVMENPDYSYIPVGQATYTPQWTEDMGELELIDWRRKELEDFWGGEKTSEEIDTAMDRFEKKVFGKHSPYGWSGPHEKITPINMQGDPMPLMDLYAQDNPELRLGGEFFPNVNYPQVSLDFLQEYIDSGNIIDYIDKEDAAGIHYGDWLDYPYGIGIDPDYTEAGGSNFATEAEIIGHEGSHGAIEIYFNLRRDAPHPYAYLKAGKIYDDYKRIPYFNIQHQPSTHFSTAAYFHPAMHAIDETFFNAAGQPETRLSRIGPINKAQMENVKHIMNYSKQKNQQANLQNWQEWNAMHDVGEHKGPVGQKIQTGTTYGPAGMGGFNSGGIASLYG